MIQKIASVFLLFAASQFALADYCDLPTIVDGTVVAVMAKAKSGDAEAQCVLGRMYADGKGLPTDKEQSTKWFIKAAEQGNAAAQFMLGDMYREQLLSDKPNYKEALHWLTESAKQGNYNSQFILGLVYAGQLTSDIYPHDLKKSYIWFSICAGERVRFPPRDSFAKHLTPAELAEAKIEVADLLKQIEHNIAVNGYIWTPGYSRELAEETAARGPNAQLLLANNYYLGEGGMQQNNNKALIWYTKSAEQGNREAQYNLAYMYEEKKNYDKATEWYHKSATNGYKRAWFQLGILFANSGYFVESYAFFDVAAKMGHSQGETMRDKVAEELKPGELEKAKKLAVENLAELEKNKVQVKK